MCARGASWAASWAVAMDRGVDVVEVLAGPASKLCELEGVLDANGERNFCFNCFINDRSLSLVMVMGIRGEPGPIHHCATTRATVVTRKSTRIDSAFRLPLRCAFHFLWTSFRHPSVYRCTVPHPGLDPDNSMCLHDVSSMSQNIVLIPSFQSSVLPPPFSFWQNSSFRY